MNQKKTQKVPMCVLINVLLFNSSGINIKRHIKIYLHHKNQYITNQFSSTATIDNCLTIEVYVIIYNGHNGTSFYMIAQCCHRRHTLSAVA